MELDFEGGGGVGGGFFRLMHEAFGSFFLEAGIDAAANPIEPACDGHFLFEFADLLFEDDEVVELFFEVGFFGLEALEFGEEEGAIAFGCGELFFGEVDLSFKVGDGAVEVVGLLVQVGVLGLQFGDAFIAFGDFCGGGVGGGLGVGLGFFEGGLCGAQAGLGLGQFIGIGDGGGSEVVGEGEVDLLLFLEGGFDGDHFIGQAADLAARFLLLFAGVGIDYDKSDAQGYGDNDDADNGCFIFHGAAISEGLGFGKLAQRRRGAYIVGMDVPNSLMKLLAEAKGSALAEAPVMTLPSVTLFPQALLPLYIFEPRYKKMVADVLASHRMFIVAMEKPGSRGAPMSVAGLGLVRVCVENPDGTSHLILQGLTRVELTRTVRARPYRIHRLRPLQAPNRDSVTIDALVAKVRDLVSERIELGLPPTFPAAKLKGKSKRTIMAYLNDIEDPDQVADVVSCFLLQGAQERQVILETVEVEPRLKRLIHYLIADITQHRKRKKS